jgi:hypothetical protein
MEGSFEELVHEQAGMVARRQLVSHKVPWNQVDHQVRARRWTVRTPRVLSTTTGPMSRDQILWLAVLHAGPRSMLGGLTAAEQHGLTGWEREDVTVLVDDQLAFEDVPGVHFFRSRRPFDLMRSPKPGIPRSKVEPALLLWAGYDAAPRAAHGVLAASVQQRLTTPERLIEWVDQLRPLRRAKPFKRTLCDIAAGAHSAFELDVRRMCRQHGMPLPRRQVRRFDRTGRPRWTDCEWELPDGAVVVLEIDGGLHLDVTQWQADLRRARRLTTPHRTVVRCAGAELRLEPSEVALDLLALGVPGRVPENTSGGGDRHTTRIPGT